MSNLVFSRCIIEQYGNYTVEVEGETLNLNGVNSQVRSVQMVRTVVDSIAVSLFTNSEFVNRETAMLSRPWWL